MIQLNMAFISYNQCTEKSICNHFINHQFVTHGFKFTYYLTNTDRLHTDTVTVSL